MNCILCVAFLVSKIEKFAQIEAGIAEKKAIVCDYMWQIFTDTSVCCLYGGRSVRPHQQASPVNRHYVPYISERRGTRVVLFC